MSDSLSAVKQVGQKVANISSDFKQSIIQAKSGGNNLETGASGSPTSAAVNKMKSASADSLKEKVSKNSPRGDNVNDSSIKNSPGNFSNPENVASTNLDIDPLMGSSVKPNPRVGQGNSYANVPSNAVMPSAMSKCAKRWECFEW